MQQTTWRHHLAFDQALVRVTVLADRLEVLCDDGWMAGREHAVLARLKGFLQLNVIEERLHFWIRTQLLAHIAFPSCEHIVAGILQVDLLFLCCLVRVLGGQFGLGQFVVAIREAFLAAVECASIELKHNFSTHHTAVHFVAMTIGNNNANAACN